MKQVSYLYYKVGTVKENKTTRKKRDQRRSKRYPKYTEYLQGVALGNKTEVWGKWCSVGGQQHITLQPTNLIPTV